MKKNYLVLALVMVFLFTTLFFNQGIAFGSFIEEPAEKGATKTELITSLKEMLSVELEARQRYYFSIKESDKNPGIIFYDIQSHWAREQLRHASHWGLVTGYPDQNFYPDNNVSGTEGIIIMSRFLESLKGIDKTGETAQNINWTIVPTWARELMKSDPIIIQLMNNNRFYGESKINRLQFSLMLAKSIGIEPYETSEEIFEDVSNISEEDLSYILGLNKIEIIEGYDDKFDPYRSVTRAEISVMLLRVINILND